MKLLIATTNQGKLRETSEFFSNKGYEIMALKNFPNIEPVEETGETFLENTRLKARGYFDQTHVPTISDDGGLMIDYLHGAPGVHSKRFLGREVRGQKNVDAILEKLKGVPDPLRTARIGGVVVFWDGKNEIVVENYMHGSIAQEMTEAILEPGFLYRYIFIVEKYKKLFCKLTEEEHHAINFRFRNLTALQEKLTALHLDK